MSYRTRKRPTRNVTAALALALAAQSALAGNPASYSLFDTPVGVTPRYIGFNMGHYLPGSNNTAWTQYSGANGYRVWASPNDYEPDDDMAPYGDGVNTLADFDNRKALLRSNPESSTYINWSYFNSRFGITQAGRNKVKLDYILGQLQQNGIDPILNISRTESYDFTGYGGMWEQWQHYYVMAYWSAKNYDVQRFQMYNEPDQTASTITVPDWELRMRVASDAVKSAIADVNRLYGKSLVAQMAGPTSKSGADNFSTWGPLPLSNNRKDYADRAQSVDNLNIYDLHRYNAIGTTFAADINSIQTQVPTYNGGRSLPVTFTEFNRYASGSFADRTDSLDTPQVFSEYATIYTGAMSRNVQAMYAFKFNQTSWDPGNGTGIEPMKTGHYYVEDSGNYNVTGATQGAEVARLIAKGFKGERPRLNQTGSAWDVNYESATAVDLARGNYHYLSINRGVSVSYDVTLNLSNIDVAVGQVVEVQEVSASQHGAVSKYLTVPANKILSFNQPITSVWLLNIPKGQTVRSQVDLNPTADAQVDHANPLLNYGTATTASVARNATTTADQATYLKFNMGANNRARVSRAVLSLTGSNAVNSTLTTLHVYGILNDGWNELTINWTNAPDLANASDAKLANVGTDAVPVGQLTWDNTSKEWGIDVTDFVRKHPDADLSFVLIREARFTNDADTSRIDLKTREAASGVPRLSLSLYDTPVHFWNTNFNANFSGNSSWDAGAPNAAGSVAVFGDFITSPHTVNVDANATVGGLTFQNWNSYTIAGAGQTLTLSNPTANAAINVYQGNHTIAAPMALATATDVNMAAGTTLTMSETLSGTAALNKLGAGTLVLSSTSNAFAGTTNISAGLVRATTPAALGASTAIVNVNNTPLQLESVTMTTSAAGINLNAGATLRTAGTSSYTKSNFPAIANTAGNVTLATTNASDTFSFGSAMRNTAAGASNAVINVTGPGRVILQSGGLSSTSTYSGDWVLNAGTLQLGPTGSSTSEALNALGFKDGDAKLGNTITVTGGTLVGAVNAPQPANVATTPSYFRAGVVLAGGSLASSFLDANFGGNFSTQAATTSTVLLYDPLNPTTPRSVNLVGGAASSLANAASTSWSGTLVVSSGSAPAGTSFNINRTGGTISVAPGALLQINPNATVTVGGAADALSDGTHHLSITNNGTFKVTAGSKNVGVITGSGKTTIDPGAALTFARATGALDIKGRATVRPNGGGGGMPHLSTLSFTGAAATLDLSDNDLIIDTGSFSTIRSAVLQGFGAASGGITSSTSNGSQILALFDNALVGAPTYNSEPLAANSIVGKYTYFGDVNYDGQVTGDDYTIIDSNLNTAPAAGLAWLSGDANLDGIVTGDDYTTIDSNLGSGTGNPLTPSNISVAAVPEPGMAMLAISGFVLATRRRRAHIR